MSRLSANDNADPPGQVVPRSESPSCQVRDPHLIAEHRPLVLSFQTHDAPLGVAVAVQHEHFAISPSITRCRHGGGPQQRSGTRSSAT